MTFILKHRSLRAPGHAMRVLAALVALAGPLPTHAQDT